VNPLGSELGHGGLSTQLKLSLLSVVCSSSARGGALVARISCDTHSRLSVVALGVYSSSKASPSSTSLSFYFLLNVILIRYCNSLLSLCFYPMLPDPSRLMLVWVAYALWIDLLVDG